MIARIWHGWTTPENAGKYEDLLKSKVFPSIEAKKIQGYRKISLLRRDNEQEVEFITIMLFDDLDCVRKFVGDDYEQVYVPEEARKVLKHFDNKSKHYEILQELSY